MAKVVFELSSQQHAFLVKFLREGISAVEAQPEADRELDPEDGERVMAEVA